MSEEREERFITSQPVPEVPPGVLDLMELTPEEVEAVRRALDKEYPPETDFRE